MQSLNRNFPCAPVTIAILCTSVPVIWVHYHCCACFMHKGYCVDQLFQWEKQERHSLPSFLPFRSCRYTYKICILGEGRLPSHRQGSKLWLHSCLVQDKYRVIKWKLFHPSFVSVLPFCYFPYVKSCVHLTAHKPGEQNGTCSKSGTSQS